MKHKVYKELMELLSDYNKCNLVTVTEKGEQQTEFVKEKYILVDGEEGFSYTPQLRIQGKKRRYIEPVARKERLIILGGGHISKELCSFAAKVGFSPWVIDEREEFANRERFPEAEEVIAAPYLETLEKIKINADDYVAIITRGHSCDGDCLLYILNHELPRYLGMIGSRHRVQAQFQMFREQGVPEEKLKMVHNPIGLNIGGVTPEEIAISILAELIAEKRLNKKEQCIQTDLDEYMIEIIAENKRPAAVATIVQASGSTPRKEGAKMLVFEDGTITGSIGGGLGENVVIRRALALIGTGNSEVFHFVMDADVAARDGMACGGEMDVLIEDLAMIEMSEIEEKEK